MISLLATFGLLAAAAIATARCADRRSTWVLVPRGRGAVHPVAQMAEPPTHGSARRAGRRNRHGAGRHRHADDVPRRHYKWVLVGIVIGSLIGAPMAIWMPMTAVPQRTALSHAFGALAAALVGIAHYYEPHGDHDRPLHDGRAGPGSAAGQPHVHGQPRGVRQTAGADSQLDQGLAEPELDQFFAAGRRDSVRHVADASIRPLRGVRPAGAARSGVRPVPGDADRRGRHADGDFAVQFLRRPVGQHDGLRARQLPADHRRGARRLIGPDPVDHHVQGDEPLVHQRAVRPDGRQPGGLGRRCVRRQSEIGLGRRCGHDARRRAARGRRARLRHGRGPGPARGARAVQSAGRAAAPRSSSPFTPWPAACRGT